MHGLAIAALIIYGVLYGLFHLIIFLSGVFKEFRNYVKKIYHKYYTQKRYNRTLLGQVDMMRQKINSKRQEILAAIQNINQDISNHQEHLKSLKADLTTDQRSFMIETAKRAIGELELRIQGIKMCLDLFKKCLAEIQRDYNGIETLFKILKFDQENRDMGFYVEQYQDLTTKISFFSQYDFISFSKDIIAQMNHSLREIETAGAISHLNEISVNDFQGSLSLNNQETEMYLQLERNENLEGLLMKDFQKSLEDFDVLKKELSQLYNKTKGKQIL